MSQTATAYETACDYRNALRAACKSALDQAAPAKGLATAVVLIPRNGGVPEHYGVVSQDSWYYFVRSSRGSHQFVSREG